MFLHMCSLFITCKMPKSQITKLHSNKIKNFILHFLNFLERVSKNMHIAAKLQIKDHPVSFCDLPKLKTMYNYRVFCAPGATLARRRARRPSWGRRRLRRRSWSWSTRPGSSRPSWMSPQRGSPSSPSSWKRRRSPSWLLRLRSVYHHGESC